MPTPEAKLARTEAKLARLRWYVVVLVVMLVFGAVTAPFGVVFLQRRITENATVNITCVSARANISQLQALSALERRLGVPVDFTIPHLPEECM